MRSIKNGYDRRKLNIIRHLHTKYEVYWCYAFCDITLLKKTFVTPALSDNYQHVERFVTEVPGSTKTTRDIFQMSPKKKNNEM